ncbi:MAG: tetratricopeptide repeat protein [Magnetovibrio sp.]|nr:tetratricopeptide repeat protein [Magnetovibrio sp.]
MNDDNGPGNPAAEAFKAAAAEHKAGRLEAAVREYRRALARDPAHLGALNNLAAALADLGRGAEAADAYAAALPHHPSVAAIHANLGNLSRQLGEFPDAAGHYERALALDPAMAEVRYALGVLLRRLGRPDPAREHLARAAAGLPGDARPGTALALLALDGGDTATAEARISEALEADAGDADAWNVLGVTAKATTDLDTAAQAFDRALAIQPDHAEARTNRGSLRLLGGDWAGGWADYRWRWRGAGRAAPGAGYGRPLWDGAEVPGGTVLLVGEQGFGDTLQFVRYAPMVKARAARVVLECRPELASLLAGAPGVDAIAAPGSAPPDIDAYRPLLDLPGLFGTGPESVPAAAGYLSAPAPRPLDAAPDAAVGLVWAGSPGHENDRNRSIGLRALAPLLGVPGVRFFSLQTGPAADQLAALDGAGRVTDLGRGLGDFADTAASLAGLDLVISVDTATAHLAGAMGRPTWLLVPKVPDWRWGLGGGTTPWYQSLTLFRQTDAGDWRGPVAALAEALRKLAGG